MELLLNRYRNLTVLLLTILAQLVLLAFQVKSNQEVRLIRVWSVTAVTPLARAIEAGLFVVAAAQVGHHEDGRTTFGHRLVVDPWGEILADGGEEPGFITARIEPERIAKARGMVPSLRHDRPFTPPDIVRLPLAAQ